MTWQPTPLGDEMQQFNTGKEAHAIGDPTLTVTKYWATFADLRKNSRFVEILISRGWK
jgi:hypothetical protein